MGRKTKVVVTKITDSMNPTNEASLKCEGESVAKGQKEAGK